MSEQAVVEQAPAKVAEWEWETARGAVKLSVDTVRRYFCDKATEQEVMHFMAVAKYHRLNPWLREVYLIKYDQTKAAQIVIGRDTHARRAEEHPQYAGDEGGIIVRLENGTVEEREGEFFLEPEQLVGGWAKIYRKDRDKPITHRVRLKDWNKGQSYWNSAPAHMIAKVARAQARHEAFPTEFAGIVSEDEAQAARGVLTGETYEAPLSVVEAEAQATRTPEAPPSPEAAPEDEAALAAEAAAREQAEAQAEAPSAPLPTPSVGGKVDRGMIWQAVVARAKREKTSASAVLKALTAKSNMAELSDAEVLALTKKLE